MYKLSLVNALVTIIFLDRATRHVFHEEGGRSNLQIRKNNGNWRLPDKENGEQHPQKRRHWSTHAWTELTNLKKPNLNPSLRFFNLDSHLGTPSDLKCLNPAWSHCIASSLIAKDQLRGRHCFSCECPGISLLPDPPSDQNSEAPARRHLVFSVSAPSSLLAATRHRTSLPGTGLAVASQFPEATCNNSYVWLISTT